MNRVVLAAYSDDWPRVYARIEAELLGIFGPRRVHIQHIGSTAVPGLSAKPVIDVLLGAESLRDIEDTIDDLRMSGYQYIAKYERELPSRRYFVRAEGDGPRVHLHGVIFDSTIWREHLGFRDALRGDDSLCGQYQALKTELAARFREDKSAYTAAKAPFVQAVIRAATAERGGD